MLLTVFTPTYNRAHTITRLFNSLKNQSFKDFEWLIVDDGSTDNTTEIVESFDSGGEFSIRYIKKENGGKHTAYNIGLEEAKGKLFFNVDSDDWLDIDSLFHIGNIAERVLSNSNCGGIIALKSFAESIIIGSKFREDGILQTFRELELNNENGERSIVFRTSIAKMFKFPIIEGEKFMPEGVVYDKYKGYTFYLSNQSLTICEYQKEGLSSNPKALMLRNPGGYKLYYRNRIDMAATIKERLGYILRYNFFNFLSTKSKEVKDYSGKYSMEVRFVRVFNPFVSFYYKRTIN